MYKRGFSRVFRDLTRAQSCRNRERKSYSSSRKFITNPEFDFEYFVNPDNRSEIEANIKRRKSVNNLDKIVEIYKQFNTETNQSTKEDLLASLKKEISLIPNSTHPDVTENARTVKVSKAVDLAFKAKDFDELVENLGVFRIKQLTNLTGRRSYYFIGELAELEHALVKYAVTKLLRTNFRLISVPDILPPEVINGCGMSTEGERTQVFKLEGHHGEGKCLAGTAEMGLAGLLMNSVIDVNDLPLCLTSVSRCHRAELSTVKEEQGLFRVHHFTKVEMFGVAHPEKSEELFQEFVNVQDEIFTSLGLDFSILEMPASDLGAPAYRKFDVEAWFPGPGRYGEISSCSNCTDYQARRLNIKFRDGEQVKHVHTVNGTACAIPRTIMAILETHQLENGNIVVPEPLRMYLDGRDEIRRESFSDGDGLKREGGREM